MTGPAAHPDWPVAMKTAGGFRWRLADERWREAACRAERFFLDNAGEGGIELLKRFPNRLIFRLHPLSADTATLPVVAKAFPMSKLRQRLFRYRRYGPAEAANLLEALRRGLPVPQAYGLGIGRKWGLVRGTIVLMEDLAPRQWIGQFLQNAIGRLEVQEKILDAALDIFVRLYHAGCNHIDMNRQSIWLTEDLTIPPKVMDFQYVRFLPAPSVRTLMSQAAYFTRDCTDYVSQEVLDGWVRRLLAAIHVEDIAPWWPVYKHYAQVRLTRDQRFAIR